MWPFVEWLVLARARSELTQYASEAGAVSRFPTKHELLKHSST